MGSVQNTLLKARGIDPRVYHAWAHMRCRCTCPTYIDYHNYGGRGITVCERWNDFSLFAADMGPHPGKGWSIDRIDNNGDYTSTNCGWATQAMQNQNQRRTKLTTIDVVEIKRRHMPGVNSCNRGNSALLAYEFGVSRWTITQVVRGARWA